MRWCIVLLALACAGCGDATAPPEPCEVWGSCLPGTLVVRSLVLDSLYPARHQKAGEPVWASGDTIAIRVSVENQSATAVDTFTLKSGFGQARRDDSFRRIIQLKERAIPRLQPNERFQFTDTAIMSAETRSTALRLSVRGVVFSTVDSALNAQLAGDTIIPVLSSGFELDMVGVPHQTWMEVWGRTSLWAKWWSHTQYTVALRIRNPYEATLLPFRLTWCEIDEDYCPVHGDVTTLTPEVPPGESREIQIPFTLRNSATRLFWDYQYAFIDICYPAWLRGTCAEFNVQLLPVFESECAVPTIVPGQRVADSTRDCDGTGSAYRFSARAGERYRVQASAGSAFIVGPEGKERHEPMLTEVGMPVDGYYYVILDQRGNKLNAAFVLERL